MSTARLMPPPRYSGEEISHAVREFYGDTPLVRVRLVAERLNWPIDQTLMVAIELGITDMAERYLPKVPVQVDQS